jgi:hypothetical protein
MIMNIVLSKSLQDLWGMLNTQMITVHLILFKCQMTVPGNIFVYNHYMSALTQKDMYPTDEIYEALFNFSDKDPPIAHFEILGYEGANFITMTGSVLINIMIPAVTGLVYYVLRKLSYKYSHIKFWRKIGVKLSGTNLR